MWWSLIDLLGVLAVLTLAVGTAWSLWYLVSEGLRHDHHGSRSDRGSYAAHSASGKAAR